MKKIVKAFAVALLFATSAHAAEPLDRGAYFGAGGGPTLFQDDGAFAPFFDDSDKGLMVFGGYKFFEYLSAELRYSDFGGFGIGPASLDASAVSAHAVGIVPFGESGWEFFGQLGFGIVNFSLPGLTDDDQFASAGGIGFRFSPTANFSLAIQTDVLVWEDDSAGPTYDLAVGGTMLTGRFIF